jgi:predicted nucleic acid-binding Zn ribbon protein
MRCYDYQCSECEVVFEHYQDSWEEKDNCKECPICKGPVARLMPYPAVEMRYSPMHPRKNRGMVKDTSKHAPKPRKVARGVDKE